MAVLKCKMCGAQLAVQDEQSITQCEHCGTMQTLPKQDDDLKLHMFERATSLRLSCEFDQAATVFQSITAQYPEEAEAYWGLCLCKYGIEYVDDPRGMTKIPTCHRTRHESILSDSDYISACEHAADYSARLKYEEEAKVIDALQNEILRIVRNEKPYDIFISFKQTDNITGSQTEDLTIAYQLYSALIERGYRVFFSKVTLERFAGADYEPRIYAALSTSKVMLLIGTKKEYLEAVWVKNEWARFLDMMQGKTDKALIVCYKGINPQSDLPKPLKSIQALDIGSAVFADSLIKSIERIIPKHTAVPAGSQPAQGNISTQPVRKEVNFNDSVYIGYALGNRPHGAGTMFYTNGNKYEGNWNMGLMQGKGTLTYNNGESWSGEWEKGSPVNGKGTFYSKDKEKNNIFCYSGEFKNGKLNGEGEILFNGKTVKKGQFIDGKLNGKGTAYTKGLPCTGEFKNGNPYNAEGAFLILKPVSLYKGTWVNGYPCGQGRLELQNGEVITGNFENGINGQAVWYYKDGSRFEGTLFNGERHGKGKCFEANGRMFYQGEFTNGHITGHGIHYLENGERYEGEFLKSKYEGNGTYFYQGGQWTGIWKNGKRFKGCGLLLLTDESGRPNGNYYNGNMENGVAEGTGILVLKDKTKYDGAWHDDHLYNGVILNAANQVIDHIVRGESKNEINKVKRARAANTALDILSFFG